MKKVIEMNTLIKLDLDDAEGDFDEDDDAF